MNMKNRKCIVTITILLWIVGIAGCGSGGNSGYDGVANSSSVSSSFSSSSSSSASSNSSSSADPTSAQTFQLFTDCMSTTPINANLPTQPVITLKGDRVIKQSLNSAYIDAGATATDPAEGDISNKIKVLGLDSIDTAAVGDYLVRYQVSNSANVPAAEAVRIVRVTSGAPVAQTARDLGTTGAHMAYYEHLPVNYGSVPEQKFPLIIFQHGYFHSRFLDSHTLQVPLSSLEEGSLVKLIKLGQWDGTRPFIVLSFQKCIDTLIFVETALRTKLFIDYAINTYQIDTSRIYMMGHSQGAGDTWDYVINYPHQLAAIAPIAGYYGNQSGCILKNTPSWAFNGELDSVVDYRQVVSTVGSINACQPSEHARVTVFSGLSHNDVQDPILSLSALGTGLNQYDIYDQSIYDWLLQHQAQ
jgi:hypothetical protein